MKFVILTEEEFTRFSKNYKDNCYLQSTNVARLRERQGWNTHFVGVKENNKVIAATLLLSKKRHIKREFYAIRGPLVDFNNTELLTFFVTHLKKYIKNNAGYMLRIDPYIEAKSLDKDGKETGIFDNTFFKEKLFHLGFKEVPSLQMEDTTQAKFMYVLELENGLEDVLRDMDSKTRQMIRKNEKMGIITRVGTIDDIPLFEDIMEKTSQRRHFNNRGCTFYKDMYECLIKDNMISLIFAELDISIAMENIDKEREDIAIAKREREEKRKLGKCNEKKAKSKEREEEGTLVRLEKKEQQLKELKQQYGNRITLGGILYILYGNEVSSLFGGSYSEFKEYQPFYTIHDKMIRYAIENEYKIYNFYAINNPLNQENEQYGIYQFKRGFGGHVRELLGEFILPVDKIIYYPFHFLAKMKNKIKGHK